MHGKGLTVKIGFRSEKEINDEIFWLIAMFMEALIHISEYFVILHRNFSSPMPLSLRCVHLPWQFNCDISIETA